MTNGILPEFLHGDLVVAVASSRSPAGHPLYSLLVKNGSETKIFFPDGASKKFEELGPCNDLASSDDVVMDDGTIFNSVTGRLIFPTGSVTNVRKSRDRGTFRHSPDMIEFWDKNCKEAVFVNHSFFYADGWKGFVLEEKFVEGSLREMKISLQFEKAEESKVVLSSEDLIERFQKYYPVFFQEQEKFRQNKPFCILSSGCLVFRDSKGDLTDDYMLPSGHLINVGTMSLNKKVGVQCSENPPFVKFQKGMGPIQHNIVIQRFTVCCILTCLYNIT